MSLSITIGQDHKTSKDAGRRRRLLRSKVGRRKMTLAPARQDGITVTASNGTRQDEILSPAALAFLADLQREFNGTRKRLLKLREERQKRLDAGELPDFL